MTPTDFIQWRELMGYDRQSDAAVALDVSAETVSLWERGRRPISQTTALACRALYHRLRPWDGQP